MSRSCFQIPARGSWLAAWLFLIIAAPRASAAKAELPAWASAALERRASCEAIDPKANALALHDYSQLAYDGQDGLRTRVEKVYLIKSREKRDLAHVAIPTAGRSDKIVKFNAWLRYPSGKIESLARKDLAMVASDTSALYSETSQWIVDRSESVRDECVFAYEYEVASKTVFTQTIWSFQSEHPSAFSRIDVVVPKNWIAEGILLNGDRIQSSTSGQTYSWFASDLPGIKDETNRLPAGLLAAQVGITAAPADGKVRGSRIRPFRSWSELAAYADEVQRDGIAPDAAIAAKARELAADAPDRATLLRRICAYAQSVNYVMVAMNLNQGGGYTPQRATDVFARHYGDCKDMTALTRSLLAALDIPSYAAIARIGEDGYVHPEWPSPLQFNHCIAAIPVDASFEGQAVVNHPQLGRLLIFDPTQRYTPLGSLPEPLYGTRILVGSERTQEPLKLPEGDPSQETSVRKIEVRIDPFGDMSGSIREESRGAIAHFLRAVVRRSSEDELKKFVKRWISNGTRDAIVESVEVQDDFEADTLVLTARFNAPRYARVMSPGLLLFAPVFLSRHEWVPPVEEERVADYVTTPWAIQEETIFTYPDGYALESAKAAVERAEPFLDYELTFTPSESGMTVRRRIQSRRAVVPVSNYADIVRCFEQITRSESAPVVLAAAAP